jgi:TRAP-type C4-dicarboxylate transport system permease small subunit
MKLFKWLEEHFEEYVLLTMLILITLAMTAQIVARYIFRSPMAWPEEFCRYCYIWTVFLSLGFTIKKGNMLRVNVVVDMFPTIVRNLLKLCVDAVMAVVFAVFFYQSILRTSFIQGTGQISPAMQVPMWLMYCATIIGFFLGALRSVQACYYDIKNLNVRAITTKEAVLLEAQEEASAVTGGNNEKGGGK